jgi:hypothetical protein
MTSSLKHATCAVAIGIALSSGIVLGQEARPVAATSRPSEAVLAQERANASASFRESIRREIARQQLAQASQQPPVKQRSWVSRHKAWTALLIGVASVFVLAGFAHASYSDD